VDGMVLSQVSWGSLWVGSAWTGSWSLVPDRLSYRGLALLAGHDFRTRVNGIRCRASSGGPTQRESRRPARESGATADKRPLLGQL
jgi:hypothetical protein